MSLPSLGSSSPAQKQRNQQLALAVFFLRRLPWARPRSSSFGFGASLSLPSCRSRAESPWILVVAVGGDITLVKRNPMNQGFLYIIHG
ncbi:uncharacterized protein LOC107459870 isoform X7 [Arachis duranensis]|uniref:Uncharacterized protein LOC107459870 isoform X7 n=1 Tax=Arachis duranensis TaxID=130453 RepID=A0A6P5MHP3_ARADU|nr:uncharacterized protein LOC107459870 isoform X7 [Arachis duranensis]